MPRTVVVRPMSKTEQQVALMRMLDAIDKWVAKLNKLALQMDEAAASVHRSAWTEMLVEEIEKFRKLAAKGPKEAQP